MAFEQLKKRRAVQREGRKIRSKRLKSLLLERGLAIARFFENDLGPQSWHRDLLKRMKLEIPGFRPKLIDLTILKGVVNPQYVDNTL